MLIKFNRPSILGFKEVLIKPGINDLPAEFVAEMQEDEIIAAKFDSGELEIIVIEGVKTKGGKEPSAVDRLVKAGLGDAKELAAKTVDLEILNGWLKREKRLEVKKAIKAQISKITRIEYRDENSKKKYEKEE